MNQADHKEGFIAKSYHILFIIYAPIALLSILLNIFSDKYSNYIFSFALLASAVSVVIAIAMWVLFWQHRELIRQESKADLPFLIRHQFILMYLPIAFSSMGLSAYYVYDKYVKTVENHELTALTNVSILVPLTSTLGDELEDSAQIKHGIGSFIANNPAFDDQYHLDIIDHRHNYSIELQSDLVKRMKKGVRYIVCAYSDVCSQLGNDMDRLAEEAGIDTPPIIITTLSSAMDLPLAKDRFYRFYVRNLEDSQALTKAAFEQNLSAMDIIATDDTYGKDAVIHLTEAWKNFGHDIKDVLLLDPDLTDEIASEKILESSLPSNASQGVFVALYQPANAALAPLSKNKRLFFSANYQHQQLSQLVQQGAAKGQIFMSRPELKAYNEKTDNTAALFIYTTLDKLYQVDSQLTPETTFHDLWMTSDYPPFLDFAPDSENDIKVQMKTQALGAAKPSAAKKPN